MKILIACEFSGIVREAFRLRGHDAWSCDLLPTDIPGQHYQGNIFDILNNWNIIGGKPDVVIGHPDCTYLTNSGVCWLYHNRGKYTYNLERWNKMKSAARFFLTLWNLDVEKICLENPIPHKYGDLPKYSQIIQPWMFGHTERKASCLWLKGLPKLKETNNVKEEMLKLPKAQQQRIHYLSPGPNRAHERSRTFAGIGKAMADQWG